MQSGAIGYVRAYTVRPFYTYWVGMADTSNITAGDQRLVLPYFFFFLTQNLQADVFGQLRNVGFCLYIKYKQHAVF